MTDKAQAILDVFYNLSESSGERLEGVYEDGVSSVILLAFSSKVVAFEADENDDTIRVQIRERSEIRFPPATMSAAWRPFIGKAFGWGWVAVNQQGYCDGVMLSFGGVRPEILLGVAASSIDVSRIENGTSPPADLSAPAPPGGQ